MRTRHVIAVDKNYMPMSEVSWFHAVKSVASGRAVILDLANWSGIDIHHVDFFAWIRKLDIIQFPYVKATNDYKLRLVGGTRAVLHRDSHICQYCGKKANTVDHVLPKSRGGLTSWKNLVSACLSCNQSKGNRTPKEANMELLNPIRSPRYMLMDRFHELARKAARIDN
jgi:hypothetical protein